MSDHKYQHNGAMSRDDGLKRMAFSLNIVPTSAYPEASAAAISTRVHDRLKALLARASSRL